MGIEWVTALLTFIGSLATGGTLFGLLTYKENKRAKQLENKQKEQDLKQDENRELLDHWKEIAEEYRRELSALKELLEQNRAKISSMHEEIADLREKRNVLASRLTIAQLTHCRKIECATREPSLSLKPHELSITENQIKDKHNEY